jgi:GNAT superfamily N-acetyltransferase
LGNEIGQRAQLGRSDARRPTGNLVTIDFEPTYIVRRITAADGLALQGLYVGALRDASHAFGSREPRPPQHFAHTAASHALSDSSTTFLMEYAKIPIGMISAYLGAELAESADPAQPPESADRGYVRALWVSFRHRRVGAGGLLLNSACQWLFDSGALEVCAWIDPRNAQAIGFYERYGFRPGSTLEPAPLPRPGVDRLFTRTRPLEQRAAGKSDN